MDLVAIERHCPGDALGSAAPSGFHTPTVSESEGGLGYPLRAKKQSCSRVQQMRRCMVPQMPLLR